ncbi:MAG: hypothetical protein OXG13_03160 [Gemmatimonadaceae bacterium]|nr:hypothetical protein [Gemmatimonadaceae bacterium]
MRRSLSILTLAALTTTGAWAHSPPGEFLFAVQFPDANIPTVDGNLAEWEVVPKIPYEYGNEWYSDSAFGSGTRGEIDVSDLSVRQIVGWNDNNNRLYLMAEVFDNVHNSDREDPAQFWTDDAWEIYLTPTHFDHVGGGELTVKQSFNFAMPPVGGNWGQNLPAFEWRVDPFNDDTWKLEYTFTGEEFGESTYYYELWIQPLDFIPEDGDRSAAEETDLEEGQVIAISWTFGDFDEPGTAYQGFWSVSPESCCQATNDMVMSELEDIDWGQQAASAVEADSWGRIKSQFVDK